MKSAPTGQRIAVTIALHPDEYDYMVKGGRRDDCGHLTVLTDDEGACRVCGCPWTLKGETGDR